MTYRRMKSANFRMQQWDRRYEEHIAPINLLVDSLKGPKRGWIPYVDSLYGGVLAEVLVLFQDPGPGTDASQPTGSGFLSPENDDPSAQLFSECLEQAGLERRRVITWNAYPWGLDPGQKAPTVSQLEAGIEPLKRLLELLPDVKVVLLMGKMAQGGWKRFAGRYPVVARQYKAISGLHTSRRGITNGGQHTKDEGVEKVIAVFERTLDIIGRSWACPSSGNHGV